MPKIFIVIVLSSCFLIFYSGCFNPVFDYSIEENCDLSDLLVFCYGSNVLGIDTTDFSIKAHIRISNSVLGGVAKLPSGGVAITHRGGIHANGGGNTLYVTDKNGNLIRTYNICFAPVMPKVIQNILFVGSSVFESGATAGQKFQIYDTDNFKLRKEYLLCDMIEGWHITSWNNEKAYFGVNVEDAYYYPDWGYSYIVELDLNTLDTTIIGGETDFFANASLLAERDGSLLYIFSIRSKDICIYNMDYKSIKLSAKTSEYPEIASFDARSLIAPHIYNNFLYGLFTSYDSRGHQTDYLVKFNPNTIEYVSHVKLVTPEAAISLGENVFYSGRFLVSQFNDDYDVSAKIIFYDIETGNIESEVTFNGKRY